MNEHTTSSEITVAAGQFIDERNYWLDKLQEDIHVARLPRDTGIAGADGDERPIQTFAIDDIVSQHLIRLGNGSDARIFMVLAAEMFLLLGKYNVTKDVIIGSPIETQEKEGDFINRMLALHCRLEEGMSFKDLLLRVRQTVIEANKNQNYPLELLCRDLGVGGGDTVEGLFDVAVLLENLHDRRYIDVCSPSLIFSFDAAGEAVRCSIEYDPALYSKESVAVFFDHLHAIMKQTLANVDVALKEVSILSQEDIQRQVREWNDTTAEYPRQTTLHQMVIDMAGQYPDKVCLQYNDIQLTYGQLRRQADVTAARLAAKGVGRGSIVPLVAGISIDTVIGMLAVMQCGAAFLPIDVEFPSDRIAYMIEDCGADLVLGAECFISETAWKGELVPLSDCGIQEDPAGDVPCGDKAEDTVYVIYTSGSTGTPKGVVVEHRNIVNQLDGLQKNDDFNRELHHILMAPITFDPSVQQIFLPLVSGAKLHLIPNSVKKDAVLLWKYLASHTVDILNTVPSMMEVMVSPEVMMTVGETAATLQLKSIILAGELFTGNLYSQLKEILEVRQIVNIYGPTEATINTTSFDCDGSVSYRDIPIGKPLQNYKVAILDPMLRLLPAGVAGELCIGGEGLARGYLNNQMLTEEKFVSLPVFDGERFYRTGDLARWNRDGFLEFAGRVDDQIKIRGQRVEPMEIDRILLAIPGVLEAVTLAVMDHDGNKQLCSYYVAELEENTPDAIRETLAAQLPGYMVPLYVMKLEKMPLTAHHKIDKKRLPEPDITASANYVAPRTPEEEMLAEIWQEVLGLEKIGVKDNYFSIGGDSIKAIKLLSIINSKLNIELGVIDLFANRTIETLANRIQTLAPLEAAGDIQEAAGELEDLKNKYLQGLQNNDG
jgi:amino acid adenylation domain-containing protein